MFTATDYYAFLWLELKALSEELGVPFLDHGMIDAARIEAVRGLLSGSHPTGRAVPVLSALQQFKAVPLEA